MFMYFRAYVSAIQTKATPVSTDPEEPLKLTAQVLLEIKFFIKIF